MRLPGGESLIRYGLETIAHRGVTFEGSEAVRSRPMARVLMLVAVMSAAPTGQATKLVAIWMDHGSPYMELRPDGSGRIGLNENTWVVEKDLLRVTNKESGESFDLPWALEDGGKKLKLTINGTAVVLEKSKQKPAAKAPPPPKLPSQLDAKDTPDAGSPKKKKGKK